MINKEQESVLKFILLKLIPILKRKSIWFVIVLVFVFSVLSVISLDFEKNKYKALENRFNNSISEKKLVFNSEVYTLRVLNLESTSIFSKRYLAVDPNLTTLIHIETDKTLIEGELVTLKGKFSPYNISSKDYQFYFKTKGINGIVNKVEIISQNCDYFCGFFKISREVKNIYYSKINYCSNIVESLVNTIETNFAKNCKENEGISRALLFGDTSKLSQEFIAFSKQVGIYHIFSFSGYQVALVASWLELLFLKYLGLRRKYYIAVIFAVFCLLIAIVGVQIPVLRSSLSIFINLSALTLLGRKISSLRSLAYSAFILLFFNSLLMFNTSFQLSFLATTGIICTGIILEKIDKNKKFVNFSLSLILPTILTSLFTSPIFILIGSEMDYLSSIYSNFVVSLLLPTLTLLIVISPIPILSEFILVIISIILAGLRLLLNIV